MKKNTKAIITIAAGERHGRIWQECCEAGWRAYAARHGYDVVCLTEPPDASARAQARSPAWQKCIAALQPCASGYDRLVWIDADIVINPQAPCICESVPQGRVGAVEVWSSPSAALYRLALQRKYDYWGTAVVINDTPGAYYEQYGLPGAFDTVVQTGVLVFEPALHGGLLRQVYEAYEEKGGPEWNYEMRPLSYELLQAGAVHYIDYRFNQNWLDYKALHYPFLLPAASNGRGGRRSLLALLLGRRRERGRLERVCATAAYLNSHFLHFAGCAEEARWVDQSVADWTALRGMR